MSDVNHIFHIEIAKNTYLISTSEYGPNEDGYSLLPGKPTTNSYLIVGEDKAILFDLAVDTTETYAYAAKLAQKEVSIVLSHGHYDHMYYLNQRTDVWLHKKDAFLLKEGMPGIGIPPVSPCPRLHYLEDGDSISLGGRELRVLHLPGHTPGSILLLDEKYRLLFSGDTVARRLLFGITGPVDMSVFCNHLKQLQKEPFERVYSAHDRCALPKDYINFVLDILQKKAESEHTQQIIPEVGCFTTWNVGKEEELRFFNVAWMEQEPKAW